MPDKLSPTCALCGLAVSPFTATAWHPDCWATYRQFIEDDFLPLVRGLAEEHGLTVLYALDPEFRRDINAITIRE